MRKIFLIILCSVFSVATFAQELKNPTMKTSFTESSGNFLVLTSFDKIGKSEITIDYVKSLRQELTDSKKNILELQKLTAEQKKEIEEVKRINSTQQRQLDEQKRTIEELKKTVNDLARKVK